MKRHALILAVIIAMVIVTVQVREAEATLYEFNSITQITPSTIDYDPLDLGANQSVCFSFVLDDTQIPDDYDQWSNYSESWYYSVSPFTATIAGDNASVTYSQSSGDLNVGLGNMFESGDQYGYDWMWWYLVSPQVAIVTGFGLTVGHWDGSEIPYPKKVGDDYGLWYCNVYMQLDLPESDDLSLAYEADFEGQSTFTGAPVPEPATMLLLGSGLIGLAGFRKKHKK